MNTSQLTSLAIAGGILYAAWKFAPNATIKAMVLGVGGVIAAKQIPYVQQYV